MNLQESIRKILREGQFDDEQISLKNKIIRHLNHMGYETNKNESDDEIINKLSSLKNDGDTQAGVFLRRITTKIKAKDVHAKAIGTFYRVTGDYIEKFRIGGNQKLQKLIGEDLFYKKGKNWWFNNPKIVNMTTLELKNLIKKIENQFKSPIQESIRKILREIEEDRVQIRLGRNAERHFGTVQNIIISLDGEDITSEDDVPGLGKMNIVIKDGEIIVGDIFIPEKYRRKGIATIVYQKISDYFGLPIVSSTIKGFNQTKEGGYIWKNRDKFKPRNLQESIRRILREEGNIPSYIKRRLYRIDKLVDVMLNDMYVDDYDNEEHFFEGLIFELGWLVRNEDFGLHDVDWGDIYDYINEYRRDDINEYYREHQKEEMMDLIKKSTLYSYKQMEKKEEEEPGWIEKTYLGILHRTEKRRVNDEDRENNPEPFNDRY